MSAGTSVCGHQKRAHGGLILRSCGRQWLVESKGTVAARDTAGTQDTPLAAQRRHQVPVLLKELGESVTDEHIPALSRILRREGLVNREGQLLLFGHHTRPVYKRGLTIVNTQITRLH